MVIYKFSCFKATSDSYLRVFGWPSLYIYILEICNSSIFVIVMWGFTMLPSDSIISSQMMQGNPQKEEAAVASEGMEESKRHQLSITTHLTMIRSQLRVLELHLYLFHSSRVFSGKLPTPQSLNICTAENDCWLWLGTCSCRMVDTVLFLNFMHSFH